MIEGLKLDFTSSEIAEHLSNRIDHHLERVKFYEQQIDVLSKGGVEAHNYTHGDPIKPLQDSRAQHSNRAEMLNVLRKHLVPGEVYRLDESDLTKIEVLSGRIW